MRLSKGQDALLPYSEQYNGFIAQNLLEKNILISLHHFSQQASETPLLDDFIEYSLGENGIDNLNVLKPDDIEETIFSIAERGGIRIIDKLGRSGSETSLSLTSASQKFVAILEALETEEDIVL